MLKTTKSDLILIAGVVCLALYLVAARLVAAPGGRTARLTENGATRAEIPLARDGVVDVPVAAGTVRLEVKGGKIRIAASPCPRKICMHTGWIGRTGEGLVCVPNRMTVRIVNDEDGALDAVTR